MGFVDPRTKKEDKKSEKNVPTAEFADLFERYSKMTRRRTATDVELPKTERSS
ncbi:MAG: hypothetical protein Q3994_01965 [Prevotella sp.]|nr:hypothetical protein [Prevotella sp.]